MAFTDSGAHTGRRCETRRQVQMLARFRRNLENVTVVLKDLSHKGARIEGIEGLSRDEAVTISLPGRKPAMAFVAWAAGMSAGLEFADALPHDYYDFLVRTYAMGRESAAVAA
ncbi:hypothetical protein [Novosphingobium album (ex Liu et al. 2023)]|uniref:PilZ domain-containing protein n=1 Tax=Novosphingobium album (ex Liu et al. 2023) TaxID=3031130 RepID=A0ABT5WLU1_9SPHN|nr:hypothetical protein [Novosphingobium album (ex Liu et al. 2023)]MDE8651018.1 hypothetical protein [Novosphingobium album (ex Liu et al. 2023)]